MGHATLVALLLVTFYGGYSYGRVIERHRQRLQD